MATATVSIPQQIPRMPIPHVPRVRPPRILKGTPSPNSVPRPPGPARRGKVWAQGQWRDPASSSAQVTQQRQSRQVEKALRHDTHGQNIYAYANIRTHQVVYSLTRVMRNTNALSQLVYHGKKTVPAALRRDHWTPYFSLHFPPNDYGASCGLLAYHRLRELSQQRQLAPPEDLITTTQQDVDRVKAHYSSFRLAEMIETNDKSLKLPKVGQLLPKQTRARKLMSQKETAVADAAFVLGLQAEGLDPKEAAELKEERRKKWWNNISRGARARATKRAKLREGKEEQLEKRRQMAMKPDRASLGLKADAATRIAMEYRGARLVGRGKVDLTRRESVVVEETVEEDVDDEKSDSSTEGKTQSQEQTREQLDEGPPEPPSAEALAAARVAAMQRMSPREVRILWSDLRDAAYAEEWPETVVHAELERMAVAKKGYAGGYREGDVTATSVSVHVIGGQKGSGWYLDPDETEKLAPFSGPIQKAEQHEHRVIKELELRPVQAVNREWVRRKRVRKGEMKAETWTAENEADHIEWVGDMKERKRKLGAAPGLSAERAEGAEEASSQTRQHTAERLRGEGVEFERPRRGILATVKRAFGR